MDNQEFVLEPEKEHFRCAIFGKNFLGQRLTAHIGKREALLISKEMEAGEDDKGPFVRWTLRYGLTDEEKKAFVGRIVIYEDHAVFEAETLEDASHKKNKQMYGHPYIGFPCFEGESWSNDLSVLTYKRQAPFNYPVLWHGSVTESLREGKNVPIIAANDRYETIVLSPLSHLMHGTVSISHDPEFLSCGLPRAVNFIPGGTVCKTLLVFGKGINDTVERWGKLLRDYHGTQTVAKDADILLSHLSYWTNAGSAYWYKTWKRESYEQTLVRLKKHHEKIGIVFGSYQLDSWWYKREDEGYTAGIMEWEPRGEAPSVNYNLPIFGKWHKKPIEMFAQDRISGIQDLLMTPIGCHFKQLSNHSVYVANNPEQFKCEAYAVPKDEALGYHLFKHIFTHYKWQLAYVVHDWLQWMNDHHSMFSDLVGGPGYFMGLDRALQGIEAKANRCGHITLQLSMAQPQTTLQSVAMKSATTIRSTSDSRSFRVEGPKRWSWHVFSSVFIEALGKYAFYDNRYTRGRHSAFELIWLGLSCGPIGIGDPIGRENTDLIHRVALKSGEIIKPDYPSKPLDRCYLVKKGGNRAGAAMTVFTRSMTEGYVFLYLLTFNLDPWNRIASGEYALTEAGAQEGQLYGVYDYRTKDIKLFYGNDVGRFRLMGRKYHYHIAAEVRNGIAFIGDVSKHIAGSGQLIQKVRPELDRWIIEGMNSGMAAPRWVFYCSRKIKWILCNGQPAGYHIRGTLLVIEPDGLLDYEESYQLEVHLHEERD